MSEKQEKKRWPNCLRGGCIWSKECERCGFDKKEDARRKAIPLTLCTDGLRRKLIPPRGPVAMPPEEDKETEE